MLLGAAFRNSRNTSNLSTYTRARTYVHKGKVFLLFLNPGMRALRCVVWCSGSTREPPANRREPPRGEA